MFFNREFGEVADVIPGFVPVDLSAAANGGNWVNMALITRLVCIFFKGAGTAGQDPVPTLQQAKTNTGGTAKALNFTSYRTKNGAIASTPQYTRTTQTAANTPTAYTTVAANPSVFVVEVLASDLDQANDYKYVQLSVPDTGTQAQIGAVLYLAVGLRFEGVLIPSNLT